MLYRKKPNFPQGSLIVKEKLTKPDSKSPELLTIMHKREKATIRLRGTGSIWFMTVLAGRFRHKGV